MYHEIFITDNKETRKTVSKEANYFDEGTEKLVIPFAILWD